MGKVMIWVFGTILCLTALYFVIFFTSVGGNLPR